MTYDQLTTGYVWCFGIYSFSSVVLLAVRHREHINFKVVQSAMIEKRKPDIPPEAQSRWNKEANIAGRIGTALFVGWVLVIFFGDLITSQ
jgi:hypothetical protein